MKRSFSEIVWVAIAGIGVIGTYAVMIYLLVGVLDVSDVDAVQIELSVILIGVTTTYVLITAKIANATKEQAEASAKAVEEMREQRLSVSRPLIIQKSTYTRGGVDAVAVGPRYFDHFEVLNAGNGPAIELVVALLGSRKNLLASSRETFLSRENFLRTGETHEFPFHLADREAGDYYLVSEYQDVSGNYHQTWLPFRLTKTATEGEIYVIPDILDFRSNVARTSRLNTF